MIRITEMNIAARLSGMDYGKYVHLLRQGSVTLPSMAEIRKRMVTIKTAVPQVARPNTPVIQYSKAGDYIARYDTVRAAAMALDVDNSCINNVLRSIYRACDGRQKTAYDYQWRYEGGRASGRYQQGTPSAAYHGSRAAGNDMSYLWAGIPGSQAQALLFPGVRQGGGPAMAA